MQPVGIERTRDLLADQLAHAFTGHGPGQAGQQPAIGQRVIGLHAPQVIDGRGRQALLHQQVIHQLRLGDTSQMR